MRKDKITKEMYKTLNKYYGYKTFRKGQEEIIKNILDGKDVLAIMPTGAGKSICYQLPSILLPGITLVISPLISLMQDQVMSLKKLGVPVAFINSTLTSKELYQTFQYAIQGKYKVLYVSPERLSTPHFINFAKEANISLITIDEAHCVSTWGHDFRPSYKLIKEFINSLSKRPMVAAFTATATTNVKEDMNKLLDLKDPFVITTGFDRPNLYFEARNEKDKLGYISHYLDEHIKLYGIIYCQTRKNVESLSKYLLENNYNVAMYHAGISDAEKKDIQNRFINDEINVIIATNAFGMGIDKPNVSYVIHYNMPRDMEGYYQEAGRAGRDGNIAEAILLYDSKDIKINEFMIKKSIEQNEELTLKEKAIHEKHELYKLSKMINYSKSNLCLRKYILNYFDDSSQVYCNNCSSCNNKTKLCDVTTEAQMILSCIKRSGEKEEDTTIISILKGIETKYILDNKYNKLTTYGILNITIKDLKHLIKLLVDKNYVSYEKENNNEKYISNDTKIIDNNSNYNINIVKSKTISKTNSKVSKHLVLNKSAKDILTGKVTLTTRMDIKYNYLTEPIDKNFFGFKLKLNKNKERTAEKNQTKVEKKIEKERLKYTAFLSADDEKLFKLLELTKRNIASKCNISEEVICKASIINDLAINKPRTIEELKKIKGFNANKIKKYGNIFIGVIKAYDEIK